jgi:hypothetical protein
MTGGAHRRPTDAPGEGVATEDTAGACPCAHTHTRTPHTHTLRPVWRAGCWGNVWGGEHDDGNVPHTLTFTICAVPTPTPPVSHGVSTRFGFDRDRGRGRPAVTGARGRPQARSRETSAEPGARRREGGPSPAPPADGPPEPHAGVWGTCSQRNLQVRLFIVIAAPLGLLPAPPSPSHLHACDLQGVIGHLKPAAAAPLAPFRVAATAAVVGALAAMLVVAQLGLLDPVVVVVAAAVSVALCPAPWAAQVPLPPPLPRAPAPAWTAWGQWPWRALCPQADPVPHGLQGHPRARWPSLAWVQVVAVPRPCPPTLPPLRGVPPWTWVPLGRAPWGP